jgi:hypothetical protein
MRDFFVNVTRYPRYLIAFGLGLLSVVLVLRAMVSPAPVA